MDLRERHGRGPGVVNRHPWELSRTRNALKAFGRYLDGAPAKRKRKHVNIGVGALYFDNVLLKMPHYAVHCRNPECGLWAEQAVGQGGNYLAGPVAARRLPEEVRRSARPLLDWRGRIRA